MNNKIKKVNSKASPSQARAYGGPATAGTEYDADRGSLIIVPDATRRAFPETWTESFVLSGNTPATSTNFGVFWTAPQGVEVVSVRMRFSAAGTSATVDVKKAPSGTAIGSGTSVLSGTMSGAGAADTNVVGSLNATVANRQLAAGDSLGCVAGGTLTNFANLTVTIELKRRPDVD